jgi:FkbM family methyltransferase
MPHDVYTSFDYEGLKIQFWGVAEGDHIIKIMQGSHTFYEWDVLEKLRDRLQKRRTSGVAIDAGAFIGTHSIYLSKICGCKLVLSYEANPTTFSILAKNVSANELNGSVIIFNKALGLSPGYANVVEGLENNQGSTRVDFKPEHKHGDIVVSTLDDEVAEQAADVALIKIDVEGAELPVLYGSRRTIRKYKPILCIEVHNFKNLMSVLSLLREGKYCILDCLGFSPTYILEATKASNNRRFLVNSLWVLRSVTPTRAIKTAIRRIARQLIASA